MRIKNSKGSIYYGMHFYSGVAEYHDPTSGPYRVFINEDTIRKMDPTFAGRPVFVLHVDEVHASVDELRKGADGWVIESFYNQADGKHWAKFIIVSEAGEKAIAEGMRLSNCYVPKSFAKGGLWNGVQYAKEISGGEYEHLAIVPNPRYDESVILTPAQFKAYNESKTIELQRLANSKKKKGDDGMKVSFFKKTKVENSEGLGDMSVLLPKSNREVTINALITEADEIAMKPGGGANTVDVGGVQMTVEELIAAYLALQAGSVGDVGDDVLHNEKDDDDEDDDERDDADEEEEEAEEDAEESVRESEKKAKVKDKKKNAPPPAPVVDPVKAAADAIALEERRAAKAKADKLRNAGKDEDGAQPVKLDMASDQIARGKARYGS